MPRKNTPKPASACPSARARRVRPPSIRKAPRPTKGMAKMSIFRPRPRVAISQVFIVVPTLEPKSTHKALLIGSRPVLTKPMLATVMAVEDCISAVIHACGKTAGRGGGAAFEQTFQGVAGGQLQALGHHVHADQEQADAPASAEISSKVVGASGSRAALRGGSIAGRA